MFHCNTCNKNKSETEFYKSHKARCKVCYRKKQQAYYDNMPRTQYWEHVASITKKNMELYHSNEEYRLNHIAMVKANRLRKKQK